MRTILAVTALLVAATSFGRPASDFDGAWVLSGKWTGYMGIALKIRGTQYKYWFYSDAGPTETPRYPLTGRAVVHGDTIELRGPGSYYDRKWHFLTYHGVPCLLADQHYREWKRGESFADDRLLFRLPAFDETRPRMNYGGEENRDGSVSRTSPLPPK